MNLQQTGYQETIEALSHERAVSSFYIHWPFCPYRCHFCPFVALAGHDEYMGDYHAALLREITCYVDATEPVALKTVFFGGGTPSTYPPEMLTETIGLLQKTRGLEQGYEMTIEVNPGTVSEEKLHAWRAAGINRLSIGVQSLNDAVLKSLNRHQRALDVYSLLDAASGLFDNLSVDIIVGLPGIRPDEWKEMIKKIVTWPIKHVSMYFLTVHEDTQLYFGVQTKKVTLPADDEVVDLYYWTINEFCKAGIQQYEISNFARPGWESRHNSVYWRREPYKGFGLGACSFDGECRTQNEKNLLNYLREIGNTGKVTLFHEELSAKQIWLEELMLGLRQIKGIQRSALTEPLSNKEKEEFYKRTEELMQGQLLWEKDGRIALTPAGLSVANEIIVKLTSI